MNKDVAIKTLQNYYSKNKITPNYNLSAKELGISPTIIRKLFGSWNYALCAAGIPITKHRNSSVQTFCKCCNTFFSVTYKLFHSKSNHYCSLSCAAKINNAKRTLTEESKRKISNSLKKNNRTPERIQYYKNLQKPSYTKIYFKLCKCGIRFVAKTNGAVNCYECRTSIRIKNGIRSKHIIRHNINLDSSWEVVVADFLDNQGIKWDRPKIPIQYYLNNKLKRYYPDFYLPDYNVYLDPKNPYRLKQDQQKLEQVVLKINLIVGDVNLVIAKVKHLMNQHTL